MLQSEPKWVSDDARAHALHDRLLPHAADLGDSERGVRSEFPRCDSVFQLQTILVVPLGLPTGQERRDKAVNLTWDMLAGQHHYSDPKRGTLAVVWGRGVGGKPAKYGDRIHAGSFPNTLFCADCYAALDAEGRIDIWPLTPEAMATPTGSEER